MLFVRKYEYILHVTPSTCSYLDFICGGPKKVAERNARVTERQRCHKASKEESVCFVSQDKYFFTNGRPMALLKFCEPKVSFRRGVHEMIRVWDKLLILKQERFY